MGDSVGKSAGRYVLIKVSNLTRSLTFAPEFMFLNTIPKLFKGAVPSSIRRINSNCILRCAQDTLYLRWVCNGIILPLRHLRGPLIDLTFLMIYLLTWMADRSFLRGESIGRVHTTCIASLTMASIPTPKETVDKL